MSFTAIRSKDWTRPHGIRFDRDLCPPDDPITDLACWLTERFDTLAAETFELVDER